MSKTHTHTLSLSHTHTYTPVHSKSRVTWTKFDVYFNLCVGPVVVNVVQRARSLAHSFGPIIKHLSAYIALPSIIERYDKADEGETSVQLNKHHFIVCSTYESSVLHSSVHWIIHILLCYCCRCQCCWTNHVDRHHCHGTDKSIQWLTLALNTRQVDL